MKLAGPEVATPHHRRERDARVRRRQARVADDVSRVRVDEIVFLALADARDARPGRRRNGVPADFGDLAAGNVGEPADLAGDDAEHLDAAVFLGVFEEDLHAEADTEERLRRRSPPNDVDEPEPPKIVHRVRGRADSGKDDTVRLPDDLGVARDDRFLSNCRERVPNARQVARTIVNENRHYAIPALPSL